MTTPAFTPDIGTILSTSGTSVWVFVYVFLAFISGILYLKLYQAWGDTVPLKYFLVHFFIVVWSGMMYLNFLSRQASSLTGVAWYLDWLVSTPLILVALGMTAMYKEEKTRWDMLVALAGLQVLVVASGIIAQLNDFMLPFWIGNIILLGIFFMIWCPLREIAQKSERIYSRYKALAAYITVFFLLYPIVWYIGVPGPLELFGGYETSLAFIILPFMCKQVYGFIDLYLLKKASS